MVEEGFAGEASTVFQQDPAHYRRTRRIEVVGVTAVPAALAAVLCTLPSPGWPLGLGLFVVIVLASIAAARLRWNADPPTLSFDPLGITYRDRHLGITFKNRSLDKRLSWSEIDFIEVYPGAEPGAGGLTGVRVKPLRPDTQPEIAFQPAEVGATTADLAQALTRFAPERLRNVVDEHRPRDGGLRLRKGRAPRNSAPTGRWANLAGPLVLMVFPGLLVWVFTSMAIDGYQATHHGIPGTAVITDIDRGRGQDAGGLSITGDFTPAGGGPTRRHVSIVTREAVSVGDTIRVSAGRPDPESVYPPDSRNWIGNIVGAGVAGAACLALLAAMFMWEIRIRRTKSGPVT
jgi:hypothetical protein